MRTAVERLRLWILVVAVLLVGGILLFFGYARWQGRRIAHDLPEKLGISIQQSTEGFTFSKSERGHTLFTLHAAKTIQYKGEGHADLHDVSITLYDASGAPADRIYGNDFDYDPANGVVRANGAVQIDLQGPANPALPATAPSTSPADENENKNIVHVKTADLVFNQKTGLVSTSKPIEFRISEAAGNATGASFDSRKGVLILARDVSFDSSLEGSPLAVRARHAQFDRAGRQLYLLQAVTAYQSSRSSSDQAIVHFRPNGSAYRIQAQGHVTMTNDEQEITSQRGLAELDTKSRPQQVILQGGVRYAAKNAERSLQGTAAEGTLFFGPQAALRHAQLRNTVSIVDEESAKNPPVGRRPKSYQPVRSIDRDVEASRIDVDFAPGPKRKPEARHILAVGGAKLNIRTLYANTPPQETSVQGDQLLVTLQNGVALSNLRGTGHTRLVLISPNGVRQTSTGDNLQMVFAPPGESGAKAATKRETQLTPPRQEARLESAEQQGNVTLVQVTPAQQAPATNRSTISSATPAPPGVATPTISTATAEQVTYEAATQLIRLSGNARLHDVSGELTASTIDFQRLTGNATAAGDVKVTYRQSAGQSPVSLGGAEPVHVVASRAHLDRAKDLSTFYGSAGEKARLWQGGDSVAAPVIEISRARRTFSAHAGSGPQVQTGGAGLVEAALTRRAETVAGKNSLQPARQEQNSVVRIYSHTLLYSDAEAKAVFHGDVVARSSSGAMTSDRMDVYFTAGNGVVASTPPNRAERERKPGAGPGNESAKAPEKAVERIVARGDVRLEEPERKATGDELVYTAQDGRFVLTGSPHSPPRLVDQAHGTVTGASLIFNDRDDSVMVSGGSSKAVTETRVAK